LQEAVTAATGQPAALRIARFAYAQSLARAGRDAEAAAQYQAILNESDGRDAMAAYNLGNAYFRLQKNEEAVAAYTRAIEQRYGHYARASNNLGLALVRLGRFDQAREAFLKAIAEEYGGFADAHYNLALLYSQQSNLKSARAEVAAALRFDPRHEDARLLAEQLKYGLSAERNSAETISHAGAKPDSAESTPTVRIGAESFQMLQLARAARDRGDLSRAVSLYQLVMRREGDSIPAIEWELAATWMKFDNAREAEESYRRLIAKAGDRYPMAYYYAGRAMMRQQKYGAAAVMLRQALARVGEAPYIYLALMDSLERLEDFEGAIQALEKYNQSRLSRAGAGQDDSEDGWYKNKLAGLNDKKNKAGRQ
jgi:tetratricopeptide (TPR) repeat protein